jgi:hypothetical protein
MATPASPTSTKSGASPDLLPQHLIRTNRFDIQSTASRDPEPTVHGQSRTETDSFEPRRWTSCFRFGHCGTAALVAQSPAAVGYSRRAGSCVTARGQPCGQNSGQTIFDCICLEKSRRMIRNNEAAAERPEPDAHIAPLPGIDYGGRFALFTQTILVPVGLEQSARN